MIKLNSNTTSYNIPTSWDDISFKQYKSLQVEKDEAKLISILCNMPLSDVKLLSESSVSKIAILLSFVQTPIDLDSIEPINEITTLEGVKIALEDDIKCKSFGQKLYLHQIIKDSDNNIMSIIEDIVLIYSQEQITEKDFDISKINELKGVLNEISLVSLYATAMSYVLQLKTILEHEHNRLSSEPTREQKIAGIDSFNEYGVFNTIDALAGGDVTKYDQIERMEYNIIFTKMARNKTQAIFDDNYRKVLKSSNK